MTDIDRMGTAPTTQELWAREDCEDPEEELDEDRAYEEWRDRRDQEGEG